MNLKRMFQGLAIGAAFLLPFSASAMSPITDSELSGVTGQSGVSINLDANIQMQINTVAWGDQDGLGAGSIASGAGWVGTSGINANVRVRADNNLIGGAFTELVTNGGGAWGLANGAAAAADRLIVTDVAAGTFVTIYNATYSTHLPITLTGFGAAMAGMDDTMTPGIHDPAAIANHGVLDPAWTDLYPRISGTNAAGYAAYTAYATYSAQFSPMTIDVATDTGAGHGVAGTTYVRIGTGSLEAVVSALDLPVAQGADPATGLDQELGSLYISGLTLRLAGTSYVDIYNGRATGQGVTLGLNVTVATFLINQLSWGDADGFAIGGSAPTTNTAGAGYVGLEGLNIAGLSLTGKLNIDLATDADGTLYAAGTTFVRLGFDGLTVDLGAVDATAVLGDANDFSGNKYTLGSLYLSGTTIVLGGFADVYATSGTSGVNVAFDLSIPSIVIGSVSWGDLDGIDAVTPPTGTPADLVTTADTAVDGYVGLKNLNIATLDLEGGVRIDVATVMAGDLASSLTAGTTFINIGLNSINVGIGTMDAVVAMGDEKTLAVAGHFQELGSLYISGLTTDIDGFLRIYAPSATSQGVILDLGATISAVHIGALSWGDNNAETIIAGSTAGYAGLSDLNLGTMTVAGKVAIDVATVTALAGLPGNILEMEYAAYETHNLSPTFVHIGIGSGNADDATTNPLVVTMASLTADVALDSVKTLANAAAANTLLGSLYMGGINVKVNGWVDIAAH